MLKPWKWGRASNGQAVVNARVASTELSRLRVEREDVELFLAGLEQRRTSASRPA
jgi:hypothetical protein